MKDLTENCRMFEEKDRRFYRKQKKVSVEGMAGEKKQQEVKAKILKHGSKGTYFGLI